MDSSYCIIKGTDRLINLNPLGELPAPKASSPLPGNPFPVGENLSAVSDNKTSLTDFAGMLGAMEHAQDLEIGFPQSGETGVILRSILRLLAKFTPQFDLFVLLFEDEILPEDQNRIFTVSSSDLASGWLAVRQPTHAAWIPTPDELPEFIQKFGKEDSSELPFSSAVAVPLIKPSDENSLSDAGHELGLLFLVAHEEWERTPLLRLAKRLSRLISKEVKLAPDCIGDEVKAMIDQMAPGDVIMQAFPSGRNPDCCSKASW